MSILNLLMRHQGQLTLSIVPYQGSFSIEAMKKKCKSVPICILLFLPPSPKAQVL